VIGALFLCALCVYLAGVACVLVTAGLDQRPRADVIVVMGAAQRHGQPSALFTARLQHALTLYRHGVAPQVMTLGGNSADGFTEASAASTWLVAHGVPATSVVAVGFGGTTWTSLQSAARVWRARSWTTAVVVTDPWHQFRSAQMARALGLHVAVSPAHSGPAVGDAWGDTRYVLRESAAYLRYRLVHPSWRP
jgi:uncharacterized SAM-binding protein YcdF (DUF218 family)